jgi:hypothetical protein
MSVARANSLPAPRALPRKAVIVTAVRLPGIFCLRIAQTTSSSVRSGSNSISASKKSACFSSGDVLPPRGLAAQRPLSRKHFTQITAVLGLTS